MFVYVLEDGSWCEAADLAEKIDLEQRLVMFKIDLSVLTPSQLKEVLFINNASHLYEEFQELMLDLGL